MTNLSADQLLDLERELQAYTLENHERILKDRLYFAGSLSETQVSQEDLEHHCNSIRAQYDEIWHYVKKRLKGDMHKAAGQLDKKIAETEISGNSERIHAQKEERRIVKHERDKIEIHYNWNSWRKIIAVEALIFVGDFVYNIFSFTVTGGSLLLAGAGALIFSSGLAIAAIKIPVVLKGITDPHKRTGAAFLMGGAVLVFFIIPIALLRGAIVAGNGTLGALSMPAVIIAAVLFTLLQSGIFLAALLFAWFLPTKKESKDKADYDKLDNEYKRLTAEIDALEGRNRAIPLETMRSLKDKVLIIQTESHLFEYIQALSTKTVHAFLDEYLLRKRRVPPLIKPLN